NIAAPMAAKAATKAQIAVAYSSQCFLFIALLAQVDDPCVAGPAPVGQINYAYEASHAPRLTLTSPWRRLRADRTKASSPHGSCFLDVRKSKGFRISPQTAPLVIDALRLFARTH